MTLQRRLMIAITLLILFLLAANLIVTLHNARLNIFEQLKVHAQDTATSLGFSITQAASNDDDVHIASMINVIFDRGYYRRVLYRDLNGEDKVRRELPIGVEGVPSWFIAWLPLPEPTGTATVSAGWSLLGEVEVVSHPGFAYQDLWRSFKEQLWLFTVTTVLCYGLLGVGLRYILRPLAQLQTQAEAICRREFPVQDSLPGIPEIRRVMMAMNHMVEKVKAMFQHQVELNDHLHEQLRTDVVTGLGNRRDFDERFAAFLSSENTASAGVLLLVRLGNLQQVNRAGGRQVGDDYLHCLAEAVNRLLAEFPNHLSAHYSGADFSIFVPSVTEAESQELMESLYATLQELELSEESSQSIYIGAVYAPELRKLSSLMALADTALSKAQSEQENGCFWSRADHSTPSLSAQEWLELLKRAVQEQSIVFYFQPVWQLVHGQKVLLFNEMMSRLQFDGVEYTAGAFMPMAARLGMSVEVDRLVIDSLVDKTHELPERLCINLSVASIEDNGFVQHIEQVLKNNPTLASRLIFELPANGLSFAEKAIREFASLVKLNGACFSLHHFGRGTAGFAYLQTLALDYLKIDRCFIQGVPDQADARFFVRSLVAIANSCEVMILAEGVEVQEQWQVLIELGIDGGQGYWLGRPSPEPVIA